jgi:hypothetical protein
MDERKNSYIKIEEVMTKKLDFDKLNSKEPRIKYGFTKELLAIGANNPELLYNHFEQLEQMMLSNNKYY